VAGSPMNVDLLLMIGACCVALVIGIETGAGIMEKIPKPLNDLATQLGRLHVAHQDATKKKADADVAAERARQALEQHIAELRKQFSI